MIQSTDNDDSSIKEFSSKDKQDARTFLRERFLRVLSSVTGKQCQIHTVENTILSGEFQGCDIQNDNYLIKNLKTPMFQFPCSLVRATDVQNITFPNAVKLSTPDP